MNKLFFITKENTVRWIKVFITKDIQWDNGTTHLVVSMHNNLNEANRPSDVKIENVRPQDCFGTVKEAQLEIMRRERFEKHPISPEGE
jgi:FKBP-type peptidyl-prolyl cis-trans isomerase 2